MQIDMFFRTTWVDQRLKETFDFLVTDNSSNYYIDSQKKKKEAENSTGSYEEEIPGLITLGQEYAEAIWTPDIYFPDSVNIERPGKGSTNFKTTLIT